MHNMHRSTRSQNCNYNPARGFSLSRQRNSGEEKGMLAEKEKSRRPKVDRFRSHLHIVSCADNDDNVSTGRNDGAFETLEDDKKSTLPL